MIDLVLPDGESGDAAAFTQNGKFLLAGHFEECEKSEEASIRATPMKDS